MTESDIETNAGTMMESAFQGKVFGEEPTDLKDRCLELCQRYLMGIWTQISVNDIEVKRLTGGMSNQVYHIKAVPLTRDGEQTQEVVIRFYGKKSFAIYFDPTFPRIIDDVVGLFTSENGLGPKIYGLFRDGQIQDYYPSRNLILKDFYNPLLLDELAFKLAQFHAMKPPLPRNRDWFKYFMKNCNQKISENYETFSQRFVEYDCKTVIDFDLKSETDWILGQIEGLKSPIVFSHNDFRPANILVADNHIILNDFELSEYYYRGQDFGSLFFQFLKTEGNSIVFEDESVVKAFIVRYIAENEKIFGKDYTENEINSVERILKETRLFALAYNLFIFHALAQNEDDFKMPIGLDVCMSASNKAIENYLEAKKAMIANKYI